MRQRKKCVIGLHLECLFRYCLSAEEKGNGGAEALHVYAFWATKAMKQFRVMTALLGAMCMCMAKVT